MKLFLDTDLLIDVATDRQPFAESAAQLLDRLQSEHDSSLSGYVSWGSIFEFSKEVTSIVGINKTEEFCAELCSFIRVANVRATDFTTALAFNLPVFRATLQAAAAIACRADLIVSSQPQQFSGLRIPVKSPSMLMHEGVLVA